ncbi:MAG: hypothetical protein DCC75_12995 [Proteobacteria bacterium]|nr:MAG: hypothetical protein DCC75_12995 [Pseudomonadota bacterium]
MSSVCKSCGGAFSIDSADQGFYARISVPAPSCCPECRLQRKLAHHNQMTLFRRSCDATGESLISHFPPDSPYKVYAQKLWWSDAFDGCEYGRPFDFNKTFFDQYQELSLTVPRVALMTDYLRDENCSYTNFSGRNKNCYLIFDSDESWDCYYSYTINGSRSCLECFRVKSMELCCEASDSKDSYGSAFIYNCDNCRDSFFLESCIGCKNCILCCNLRQKEYYIRNRPASREEFEALRKTLSSWQQLQKLLTEFEKMVSRFPRRALRGFHNENVSGDYLVHCKDAQNCYDCLELRDGKYCYQGFMALKDCMDCEECGEGELLYECSNLGYNAYNCRFSHQSLSQISNLTYCDHCFNGCSDLFGCISLRRKKHCVLNQQYTESEYNTLVPRIIEHMRGTGEWGEFFPMQLSPFPYNISMAQDQFPLSREQAAGLGLSWYEGETRGSKPATFSLPPNVAETPESVCQELLNCERCGKNYKLIPQELAFYKSIGLALPRSCFQCRHAARFARRNPRKLHERFCERCGKSLQSTFSTEQADIVYCENCFSESME